MIVLSIAPRVRVAGGDPLDRDPAKVVKDVQIDLVSHHIARAEYGVVLDEKLCP